MFRPFVIAVFLLVTGAGLAMLAGPPGTGALAQEESKAKRCVDCHETSGLLGTSHEVLDKTSGGACVDCHGTAAEHAAAPSEHAVTKGIAPDRLAELCSACHSSGPDHVAGWKETVFAKDGKSCADCHVVHEPSDARLSFTGDEKGNLGDDSCRMCHAPTFAAFGASFHAGVLGKSGGGCEACHGPGREHALAARSFARGEGPAKIAREPEAGACLLCHRAIPERHAREMPVYREKRADCVICHDVHVDRSDPQAALTAGAETMPVRRAAAAAHASRLAEGGGERCHGPAGAHGASGGRARYVVNPERQSPEAASALCLSCHGSSPDHAKGWKDGPLAAQGMSCLTCHEAHAGSEGQGKPATPSGAAVPVGRPVNVGSRTCATCHVDPHPFIGESPHAVLLGKGKVGCESCHGPGSAHVSTGGAAAGIKNPSRLPEERRASFCLSCHGREDGLISWHRGEHARAGVSCTKCHDPLTSDLKSSKKKDPELCQVCHQEVAAQFRLPNRHPLRRGAVRCGSCHDPHGDPSKFLNLELRKERCFSCHRNVRGPFLYEHEADRTDGCVICHMPHGSPNRRLLTHSRVSDLCIQCHVTPASHNLASGSAFRNCLNCHGSIHGSYVDENFFR